METELPLSPSESYAMLMACMMEPQEERTDAVRVMHTHGPPTCMPLPCSGEMEIHIGRSNRTREIDHARER